MNDDDSNLSDDDSNLALSEGQWLWFIQSYDTMDTTAKALSTDPLQSAIVNLLTESLDSAKILLSTVLTSSSNHMIRFPLRNIVRGDPVGSFSPVLQMRK
jgi:hypothetical protein